MTNDKDQLQGVWKIVNLEIDGHSMPGAALAGASITVDGDRFTSSGMGSTYEGILELDATASPKSFELKFNTGPEIGNTNLGIYELNGETWRICLATQGTTRPQKFEAPSGTGIALQTLQRG